MVRQQDSGEMEFQQAVGTVKALMHEIGIDVPAKIDMPKCKLLFTHRSDDRLYNYSNSQPSRMRSPFSTDCPTFGTLATLASLRNNCAFYSSLHTQPRTSNRRQLSNACCTKC